MSQTETGKALAAEEPRGQRTADKLLLEGP